MFPPKWMADQLFIYFICPKINSRLNILRYFENCLSLSLALPLRCSPLLPYAHSFIPIFCSIFYSLFTAPFLFRLFPFSPLKAKLKASTKMDSSNVIICENQKYYPIMFHMGLNPKKLKQPYYIAILAHMHTNTLTLLATCFLTGSNQPPREKVNG